MNAKKPLAARFSKLARLALRRREDVYRQTAEIQSRRRTPRPKRSGVALADLAGAMHAADERIVGALDALERFLAEHAVHDRGELGVAQRALLDARDELLAFEAEAEARRARTGRKHAGRTSAEVRRQRLARDRAKIKERVEELIRAGISPHDWFDRIVNWLPKRNRPSDRTIRRHLEAIGYGRRKRP